LTANASRDANHTATELAEQILAEAAGIDAAEDAVQRQAGDHRGLPAAVGARAGRRARLRALLDELLAEEAEKSYQTHMAKRAEIEKSTGRPIRGRRPSPTAATHKSRQQVNLSDPDSRLLKTKAGYIQGYNAQAVATEQQFVIAAEVTNCAHDAPSFVPLITATKRNLKTAGEQRRLRRVVADAGYWSQDDARMPAVESFIAPGRARQLARIAVIENGRTALLERVETGQIDTLEAAERLGVTRARVNQLLRRRRAGDPDPLTTTMIAKLETRRGRKIYKKRAATIEPIFGQIKHNRQVRNLSRRGCRPPTASGWKLICTTHNLLKLWRLA
jgi:hypothetical protein